MYQSPFGKSQDMRKMDEAGKDQKMQELVQNYDNRLLGWLVGMHKMLNKDEFTADELRSIVSVLDHLRKESTSNYVKNLVYPEDAMDAKIPSRFPVPSASIQVKTSFPITTNARGHFSAYFNPWFLGTGANSTIYVNNDVSLLGTGSSNFFTSVAATQNTPGGASIFGRYRLVSCAIHVRYIGDFQSARGELGCGITFDSSIGTNSAVGFIEANGARYGDFNLINETYFNYKTSWLNGNRVLYIPVDNSQEEYIPINTSIQGEALMFYGKSLPPSTECIEVEVYSNFECLADASYQNFLPSTQCSGGSRSDITKGAQLLSERKDLAVNSIKSYEEQKPNILKQLFNKGVDILGNLAVNALPSIIPGGQMLAKYVPAAVNLASSLFGGSSDDMVD